MAREFEVKFELIMQDIDTKKVVHHHVGGNFFDWPRLNLGTEKFGIRYYIHPDSLKMLKPQEEDLCCFAGDEFYIYDGYEFGNQITKIIERNGKAFFMPEEE